MPARPALAAARALQVIDLLVLHPSERFTLTEIATRTAINPASTHALLNAMTDAGYLQRHVRHKTYGLGPALVATAGVTLQQSPGLREACARLDDISHATSLEAQVTVTTAESILVVAESAFRSRHGAAFRVGQRLPLVPPLGTVFLAWAGADAVERWLARAEGSLRPSDIARHRRALDAVRRSGFAVSSDSALRRRLAADLEHPGSIDASTVNQRLTSLARSAYHLTDIAPEQSYEVTMIAAPVFDAEGAPVAALVLSGFAPETTGDAVLEVADHLVGEARLVTKHGHGRPPSDF